MKMFYYFCSERNEKEKGVIRNIYGSEITFVYEKPWTIIENFGKGDILICGNVDELSGSITDTDQTAKEYMNIYNKGVELFFDKSTQCNSLFIKTLIEKDEDFETVLRKCIVNYQNQHSIEEKYLKIHVITAKRNGNKVGIKKGTKLITKKSELMKFFIVSQSKDFYGKEQDEELVKKLGIARNTYYKYKKELKDMTEKELEDILNDKKYLQEKTYGETRFE